MKSPACSDVPAFCIVTVAVVVWLSAMYISSAVVVAPFEAVNVAFEPL